MPLLRGSATMDEGEPGPVEGCLVCVGLFASFELLALVWWFALSVLLGS